jgi:hypothetical protein
MSNSPALLHTISLKDIKSLRDPAWEDRERSYHDAALEEVNHSYASTTVSRPTLSVVPIMSEVSRSSGCTMLVLKTFSANWLVGLEIANH